MQATWQQVLDSTRSVLNDNIVAGGTVWVNARLQEHAARGYRKMFDAFDGIAANRVRHTVYFILQPNMSVWYPTANLITDMAEPETFSERGVSASGVITATGSTTPIQATSTAHGLGATNAVVDLLIGGVANTTAPWGRWFATIVDPDHFNLNGSVSDGVAGVGGMWSQSGEKFVDLIPLSRQTDRDVGPSLVDYVWENNTIYFRGANTQRQMRLIYVASGTAPTNTATVINIDNCLNFISTAAAAYAARASGWYQMADYLMKDAFGPKGEADASGGMLRDLIAPAVLEMQREQRYPRTFRSSKNSLIPYFS